MRTIKNVNQVVDNQMKVVQEIAGLLGETTAQTKSQPAKNHPDVAARKR